MNLNGVEYYYIRNAQGDIIGLIDDAGTEVVTYSYDSWGKLISIDGSLKDTVGTKNPYRYRGYRYDSETGLYYLQSRYYNPEWGRFINADSVAVLQATEGELLGHNLYAYALNNPVNMEDPEGYLAWWVGAAIGGAVLNTSIYLIQNRNSGITLGGIGKAAATGAITGVAFGGAGKAVSKGIKAFKGTGNFTKKNGGSNANDFISGHSQKHMYNPNTVSTPKKTQYGKDINVSELRRDTMLKPDSVVYDDIKNTIAYKKNYNFNISTPDTPTGQHRVFINLNNPSRHSQFPYFRLK